MKKFAKKQLASSFVLLLFLLALTTSAVYAWLSNSLESTVGATSYVHKSYFESGDGTSTQQYNVSYDADGNPTHGYDSQGNPLTSEAGCAFEIRYPLQLYYFAWLQNMGYFNEQEDGAISQIYFYLSDDLDMTGWVLPQIGTQEHPFVGNFDGNGHTVSNLTIQNKDSSGGQTWVDAPESQNITGLNIVGFFGVIGQLGTEVAPGGSGTIDGYTYSSSVNEVKNFIIEDAVIKTDLSESLVGIAAGYVNGTMENVKVVGGTISNVSATTALTSYTTGLSDFGAVGYCTEPYKGTNQVTTVKVYDPQAYTNSGSGATPIQGNNWGGSVEMQSMYNDLRSVFDNYATPISGVQAGTNVIEVTTDGSGNVTSITVTGDGTAPLTASAGNQSYTLKLIEKKEDGDTVAYYNFVPHPQGSADFMYLYGDKIAISESTTEGAVYIHTENDDHYFSINAAGAFADQSASSSATKWIVKDGMIYTVRSRSVTDPETNITASEDYFCYVVKNAGNALELVEAGQREALPASVAASPWEVGADSITTGGYALVYENGAWTLSRISMVISDNASANFLSVSAAPAIVNQTTAASASRWVKESASGSASGFYLAVTVGAAKYYLDCSGAGTLSLGTAAATVWYEDAAVEGRHKVYTLTSETGGYALYFDGTNWDTTGYTIVGQGNDWGGSIDIQTLNTRIHTAYGTFSGTTGVNNIYSYSRGDFSMVMSRNSVSNPNTTTNVYRHRAGTVIPINMDDSYSALSSNTGYFVGSNIGTGNSVNASPKSSSYNIDYICRSLSSDSVGYAKVRAGTQAKYNPSTLEVLTYYNGGWHRITDNYNSAHSSVHSDIRNYSALSVADMSFEKYDSARESLNVIFTDSSGASEKIIHGIHYDTNVPSAGLITRRNVSILGEEYIDYPLVNSAIDFNVKKTGKITFFAGAYYDMGSGDATKFDKNQSSGNYTRDTYFNDSFFSLSIISRDANHEIISLKKISKIYKDADGTNDMPYIYEYSDGSFSSAKTNSDTLVFDLSILDAKAPVNLALYYFEIPVNPGEYAIGAVSASKTRGAYLVYLDIAASATVEGDSKIMENISSVTENTSAGDLTYTGLETREADYPTFYPLAWDRDKTNGYRGDLPASTNTGYVISGSNAVSNPPGDIRVSRYTKYAQGNWASIRNSLTSANNAGILNNNRVYTIINGQQQSITAYGIGNQYTTRYAAVAAEVNGLLRNQQYVYGLHFMQASISAENTITIPKAVINGVTYTDREMPQDSIDFVVQTRGRITFMAGTYFSGSQGTQSFFSLHRVFRDGSGNITDIKELSEIYGDGNAEHLYYYRYKGDAVYYASDGSAASNTAPAGYEKLYDTAAIADPTSLQGINSLTQNTVYYFEIPSDPGEFALGSSSSDGAYLIYLDIAANADFDIKTTVTEVTETTVSSLVYPKGVAFVDAADSTAFDTNGVADPEKSVFLSIPIANSAGNTVFSITSAGAMTVTNTTSSLAGYEAKTIPPGNSLTVNNGTPITLTGAVTIREIVTEVDSDPNGSTVTTVTTTTQTTENGVTTTTVEQTVTTVMGATSNTVTTSPAPSYDGHALIPTDYTVQPSVPAQTILEYRFIGSGLTNNVARNGDLNIITTDSTVTVGGDEFIVCDVVKSTDVDGTNEAGRYDITISGAAGTYTVTVIKFNGDFEFYVNGATVSAVGDASVTVAA